MGNYANLRILNQPKNVLNDITSDDAVAQVARMIDNSGANRKERRRLERDLGKVENIVAHTQARVDKSAYKEYEKQVEEKNKEFQKCLDSNFLHFMSCLAMTMYEDYRWREDKQHDQISSLLERVINTMEKYARRGYSTEAIVKMVDEKLDIQLVAMDD